MKKLALAAVLFSVAGLSMVACGSACDDYATKAKACCDKVTDAAAKDACNKSVDSAVSAANNDACQAALDALGSNPLCK